MTSISDPLVSSLESSSSVEVSISCSNWATWRQRILILFSTIINFSKRIWRRRFTSTSISIFFVQKNSSAIPQLTRFCLKSNVAKPHTWTIKKINQKRTPTWINKKLTSESLTNYLFVISSNNANRPFRVFPPHGALFHTTPYILQIPWRTH